MEGPEGEMNWPQGFSTEDIHITGVIFAAAMWDLRQALVAEMGEEAGVAYADQLFYGAVQRATDVFTTYAEILAEDDDDGNLANGTPNKCLIDYAFGSHGIGDEGTQLLGPGLEAPIDDRYNIIVPTRTPANGCAAPAIDGIDVTWRLRGDQSEGETLAMELDGAEYRATIPTQPEVNVIEYQVTVRYADGNTRRMPLNRGEPFYEFYIGDTDELYCTDFETDPTAEWTFGSNAGINDWEWGTPQGNAGQSFNFDPPAAFSGNNVIGTGLSSPGGAYQTENASFAESPVIDVPNPGNIHVQYRRWLGVESSLVDRATISANNSEQYVNAAAPNALFAIFPQADHEWRFHDVDISDASAGGSVQVRFELADGGAGTHAGWNVDDFCVVKAIPSTCGDSRVTGNENCDEGEANSDTEADACRATTCQPATCGDAVRDTAEECDDGNDVDDDDCSNACIDQSSGCGCQSGGGASGSAVLVMLLALGYVIRRRRCA
jgi:MYXO-CTERM domain-containing protein